MTEIRLDEIVLCKLCDALVTRDRRARHLEWHARLNARLWSMGDAFDQQHWLAIDAPVAEE